jgi:uncharacterized protein
VRKAVGGLIVLGAAAAAYGVVIEPRWYRTRRETIRGVLSPTARRPLRLLVVSDLHHLPPDRLLERQIRRLSREGADLVIAAGDLLGGPESEEPTVDLLSILTADATPGVAVLGSNDLFAPSPKSPHHYFLPGGVARPGPRLDTKRLVKGLTGTGWTVLADERARIETACGPVEVSGLRDPHLPTTRLPELADISAREPDAIARIGIVHAPYVGWVDHLVTAGYDLVVSGHTHGGQVRVPGIGALTTNSDLPLHRARGTSTWGSARLHVSAGLGQSPYARVRFACRPEASVLDLV